MYVREKEGMRGERKEEKCIIKSVRRIEKSRYLEMNRCSVIFVSEVSILSTY